MLVLAAAEWVTTAISELKLFSKQQSNGSNRNREAATAVSVMIALRVNGNEC